MKYVKVDADHKIQNIIVADSTFAEAHGALPYYDGATIGQPYNPPEATSLENRVAMLESELSRIKNTYVNTGESR